MSEDNIILYLLCISCLSLNILLLRRSLKIGVFIFLVSFIINIAVFYNMIFNGKYGSSFLWWFILVIFNFMVIIIDIIVIILKYLKK